MVYLVVSIISAMAIALSVYVETSSFWLAFAAYSLTGTLVLSSVLVSAFFAIRAEDEDAANV
ncbi:MAG: hypothetical protein HKN27_15655 [Silicimonas sp.]|nr:hypothetical protein [Silicimonas sp.]